MKQKVILDPHFRRIANILTPEDLRRLRRGRRCDLGEGRSHAGGRDRKGAPGRRCYHHGALAARRSGPLSTAGRRAGGERRFPLAANLGLRDLLLTRRARAQLRAGVRAGRGRDGAGACVGLHPANRLDGRSLPHGRTQLEPPGICDGDRRYFYALWQAGWLHRLRWAGALPQAAPRSVRMPDPGLRSLADRCLSAATRSHPGILGSSCCPRRASSSCWPYPPHPTRRCSIGRS